MKLVRIRQSGVVRFIMTGKYTPWLNYLSLKCHKIMFKPIKTNLRARYTWQAIGMHATPEITYLMI